MLDSLLSLSAALFGDSASSARLWGASLRLAQAIAQDSGDPSGGAEAVELPLAGFLFLARLLRCGRAPQALRAALSEGLSALGECLSRADLSLLSEAGFDSLLGFLGDAPGNAFPGLPELSLAPLSQNLSRHCLPLFERLSLEKQIEALGRLFFAPGKALFDCDADENLSLLRGALFLAHASLESALRRAKAPRRPSADEAELLQMSPARAPRANPLAGVSEAPDALSVLYARDFEDPLLARLKRAALPLLFDRSFLAERLGAFSQPSRLLREIARQAEAEAREGLCAEERSDSRFTDSPDRRALRALGASAAPADREARARETLATRAEAFLMCFARNVERFSAVERARVFSFACEHFDALVPSALFEHFESNLADFFSPRPLLGAPKSPARPPPGPAPPVASAPDPFIELAFYYCRFHADVLRRRVPPAHLRQIAGYCNQLFSKGLFRPVSPLELDLLNAVNQSARAQGADPVDLIRANASLLRSPLPRGSGKLTRRAGERSARALQRAAPLQGATALGGPRRRRQRRRALPGLLDAQRL